MASSVEHITLVSNNDDEFQMTVRAALKSNLLKRMIEDDCVSGKVPLNTNTATLVKVMEYCQKHADHDATKAAEGEVSSTGETDLKEWDAEFVTMELRLLFDLINAANYLEIESLLDLTCQTMADSIKDKSVEEVRRIFNIKNDYTPEEEEEIRKKHSWAFE